jgi:arylsulfatase A-like enzyme
VAGIGLVATTFMAARRPKNPPATDLETTGASDPNTPNILLFVVDDLDADTLQRMLDANQLPNIKSRIVDGAVNFQNTYVPTSICSPSRASLLTGKFAHNHGVWHIVGNEGPEQFDNYLDATDNAYLPKWLSTTHYRAFVGKFHLGARHPQWDFFRPVDGYDPRPGMYKANEDGANVWPNVYQTKYIGDSAKQAIAQSGDRPFFLLVAPTPIHVNVSSWVQRSGQAQAQYTGAPVAFAQFPNDDTNGWRQHLVTVDFSSGAPFYRWWSRDSQQRDSGWGKWANAGNASTVAPNTGNGAVVGWNVLLPAADVRRQQLVRQTGSDVEFYSRDFVGDAGAGPWTLSADESTLAGTGSMPVAGWAAAAFPSGVIRQQVVRGSETQGYVSYVRHSVPSGGGFTPWRLDPDWGETVVFGRLGGFSVIPTEGARYIIKLIIRRPGSTVFEWWQSGELIDFQELAVTGSAGDRLETARTKETVPDEGDQFLDPAMKYDAQGYTVRDKDDALAEGPQAIGNTTIVTEVHPYFLLRAYAEGNWSPVVAGQTYTYGGGNYPAGSLRANRDPNGFTPFSAQFDLPRGKPSFNRQLDLGVPFFSPAAWPELTNPVPGNKQQQTYLGRLLLDRMEQLISLDRMVGEVVTAAGPNTIIIFTSDNGHFNGEHRLGNKLSPQEESVRVPLYIRSPGSVKRDDARLIANIDIAPTILDYAGRSWVNPVFNVDGRSLRSLVEGGGGGQRTWRRSMLVEFHAPRGLLSGRDATDWRFGLPDYLGLRQVYNAGAQSINSLYTQYYVNIAEPTSITDFEYYLMDTDPNQTNNLATGRIIELDQILNTFYVASGEACRQQDMQSVPAIV